MQLTCLDIGSMARYVHRLSELEETVRIELHVDLCGRCRERLLSLKRHSDSLFEELEPGRAAGPACPSTVQLQHWVRGALSERQMVRVQEHVRRCDACRAQITSGAPGKGRKRGGEASAWLATRSPDLDLRVAPEGIRIAAGMRLVDGQAVPALADRLGLREPVPPAVTSCRQIHFRLPLPTGSLGGRIALTGLDGIRLELHWWGNEPIELELWNREHIESRFQALPGIVACSRLLPPGHWFVGTSALEAPWLAVAVEGDLLAAGDLAVCAYDRCRHGRFHSALTCLAKAATLAPGGVCARMHAEVERFARGFDLAGDDHDIQWLRRPARRSPAAVLEPMDLSGDLDRAVERVAALVRALQRSAERVATRTTAAEPRVVSRRSFRPAYARLLQSLRASLSELGNEEL